MLFIPLGAILILFSGSVEMDDQTITYQTPFLQYQINWDEVSSIEIDKQGYGLVFSGENKSLAVIGPAVWSGKDKMQMLKLIDAETAKHSIKIP